MTSSLRPLNQKYPCSSFTPRSSAQSPCAAELLPSAFGIVPVIEEEDWIVAALERNLTELPGGQGGAVVIQNLHDVAGINPPH